MTSQAPADFVAAVVRPEIRGLAAYAVARARGMIKLDAMENPYGLSGEARAEIAAASGSQLDPAVADALLRVVGAGDPAPVAA